MSTKRYAGSYYYQQRQLGKTDDRPVYYVYLLINPLTNKVFYVGKGKWDRMYNHVADVKRGKITNGINGKLFRHIKEILDKGLEPLYDKPMEHLPEIDALALEAAFIDYYGLDNLCNYQPYGFGCPNHNKEIKDKCRDAWLKQHGYSSYDAYLEDKRKRQLKEDLELLDTIIKEERQKIKDRWEAPINALIEQGKRILARKEKRQRITTVMQSRLIVKCNRNTNEYVRLCPRCKKELTYDRYESLMATARHGSTCLECMGKDFKVRITNLWKDEEFRTKMLSVKREYVPLTIEEKKEHKNKTIEGIQRKLAVKYDEHLARTLQGML